MTPEGRVKAAVKRELDRYPHYREMPVPSGYGTSGLDFTVCIFGKFLAIETKAEGKQPTERQYQRIREIDAAGGLTAIVIGVEQAKTEFRQFLWGLSDATQERMCARRNVRAGRSRDPVVNRKQQKTRQDKVAS